MRAVTRACVPVVTRVDAVLLPVNLSLLTVMGLLRRAERKAKNDPNARDSFDTPNNDVASHE